MVGYEVAEELIMANLSDVDSVVGIPFGLQVSKRSGCAASLHCQSTLRSTWTFSIQSSSKLCITGESEINLARPLSKLARRAWSPCSRPLSASFCSWS